MNPDLTTLVNAVNASGASVRRLGDGKFSLVGSVPDEVLAAIRANRDAFIEAYEEERRTRYLRPPPADLLMRGAPPNWRADTRKRVEEYALGQGGDIGRWVVLRGTAYREAYPKWSITEAASAALADLLHWQFSDRHSQPEEVLRGFDEVLVREPRLP